MRFPLQVFLLVEGDGDANILQRHLSPECRIEVMNGKPRVIEMLELCRARGLKGVLGIVDCDYDHLIEPSPSDPDLIFIGPHDMDMLLFCSAALDYLLYELADVHRLSLLGDIRAKIINIAMQVGAARLVCRRKSWSVQFDGIDFERFIDLRRFTVDLNALIRTMSERQAKAAAANRLGSIDEVLDLVQREINSGHSPRELSRGHDAVAVLSLALRGIIADWNKSDVKPERLEMELRLAFDSGEFKKTELFSSLLDWEKRNAPFKIFGDDLY